MKLFDLHCDTATEAFKSGRSLDAFTLPLGVPPYARWTQTMAFFLNDTRRENGWDFLLDAFAFFQKDRKTSCPAFSDYADGDPAFRFLNAIENVGWICADEARIDELYAMGFWMASLCWNGDNPLCGGSHGVNGGLTGQGKNVIARMEKNRMALDVSHCSDASFADICRATDLPLVASHSNCRALCGHQRNLTDDQIREICRRGGLIGINFYTAFLHETQTDRPYELVIGHLEHILRLGGENAAAIGSDFDGAPVAPELRENLCGLYKAVESALGMAAARKIFFENAEYFFTKYFALSQGY